MCKNIRIKLFSVLILSLLWPAVMYGQSTPRVTVNADNATLTDIFRQIEQQTTYLFSYRNGVIDNRSDISLHMTDAPVNKVLDAAFRGRELAYSIVSDKSIVVTDRKNAKTSPEKTVTIAGTVLDETGEPLPGATVMVKGSTIGTSTDINGRYSLAGVPENSTVKFSMIGCMPQEIKATDSARLENVKLAGNTAMLNEVVVVGYGTQSEKLLTTSISSLKVDDIDQGNEYNVAKMLQGRTPGVSVASGNGTPGKQPNVRVRGIASISGNSTPLYVVDGIPTESMPMLNPNDIERMDVLKDASATAIYGSRANSGVIIITTKSGKTNSTTDVSASVRHAIGWIANDIKMANSAQYIRTMQQAVDNYNVQFLGLSEPKEFFIPDVIDDTDWVGLIQRERAHTTNANISVRGGTGKTTFFTSVGYNGQEGILRKSKLDQVNALAKFSHEISRIFKLNLNLRGSYSRNNMVEENSQYLKVLRTAREEAPWIGPYNPDGSYTKNGTELLRHNPVMLINEEDWILNKKQGLASVNVEVTPIKGLKYTPSFSIYGILDETRKTITERHDARKETAGWGALEESKDVSHRIVVDNVIQYDNSVSLLDYSVMAGHSYEKYQYETFGVVSDNYKDGAYPSSNFGLVNSGSAIYPSGIGYNAYAIESIFGRIALNWDNRYILNASLRSDGCSRFSKDHRYGTFPSASVAWRASEEEFFPKDGLFNDLKLRLSWGQTGNMSGISNWAAMSLVTSGGSSYDGESGFKVGNQASDLTWEKATEYNIGINGEMLNNRIRFGLDAFMQRTSGLLYATSVIATSGYSSITTNIGKLENKGIEFSVDANILQGEFKWNLSANISYIKNKLLSLDGNLDMKINGGGANTGSVMHALIVGKPVSAYYMLEADGLYQHDSEVPAKLYSKGVRAGDVKFVDHNNDGDISDADKTYVGKVTPDVYGGITSNMSWKNFDLSIFCQYAIGGKILAAWKGCGGTEGTETLGRNSSTIKGRKNGGWVDAQQYFNVSEYAAEHYWHGPGTSNTVPRPVIAGTHTGGYGNNLVSTRYLEDASYFKIKTITLGYNVPSALLSKIHVKGARVYVSLDNFFTFTKYDGYDPEFSYDASPTGNAYGSDYGEQATLKSFIVGASINF